MREKDKKIIIDWLSNQRDGEQFEMGGDGKYSTGFNSGMKIERESIIDRIILFIAGL